VTAGKGERGELSENNYDREKHQDLEDARTRLQSMLTQKNMEEDAEVGTLDSADRSGRPGALKVF